MLVFQLIIDGTDNFFFFFGKAIWIEFSRQMAYKWVTCHHLQNFQWVTCHYLQIAYFAHFQSLILCQSILSIIHYIYFNTHWPSIGRKQYIISSEEKNHLQRGWKILHNYLQKVNQKNQYCAAETGDAKRDGWTAVIFQCCFHFTFKFIHMHFREIKFPLFRISFHWHRKLSLGQHFMFEIVLLVFC